MIMPHVNHNVPVVYRLEKFDSFQNACCAYGLSPKYVQKFLEVGKTQAEALNIALHYRDVKTFYGLIVYPHKVIGLIDIGNSEDVERCSRIIKVHKKARVERFDLQKHLSIITKFNLCIKKLRTLVDRLKAT